MQLEIASAWSTAVGLAVSHFFLESLLLSVKQLKQDAGFLAYQAISSVGILMLVNEGMVLYWQNPSSDNKLFGYHQGCQVLGQLMLGYQFYNTLACFMLQETRNALTIGHHIVTAICALAVCSGYMHWFAPYCFGLFEVSSIPLAIMDIFDKYPQLAKDFSMAHQAARASFAASFLGIRIMLLIVYLYELHGEFWPKFLTPGLYREQSTTDWSAVSLLLVFSTLLSSLQLVWAKVVISGLLEACGLASTKKTV